MISAGIDAGLETIKVVLLNDGAVLSYAVIPAGKEATSLVVQRAMDRAANEGKVDSQAIANIVSTGMASEYIPFKTEHVGEVLCCVKGVSHVHPSTRTVIDVGAEKCLVAKCRDGKAIRTARNEVCAAGSGRYLEMVASVLGIDVREMGQLAMKSTETVEVNTTCAVFAESEVISLLHLNKKPEDILRGVFKGMADRIYSLLTRVDFEKDVTLIGGLGANVGIIQALEERIGGKVHVPENANIVEALGAALIARERGAARI